MTLGIPGGRSSSQDLCFHSRVCVQSLVGELQIHNKKKKQI